MTTISIAIPDVLAHQLQRHWDNLSEQTLEALAISAYRAGIINEVQVQEMLKLPSRWAANAFLKNAGADIAYTATDLEQDILAISKARQDDRCE